MAGMAVDHEDDGDNGGDGDDDDNDAIVTDESTQQSDSDDSLSYTHDAKNKSKLPGLGQDSPDVADIKKLTLETFYLGNDMSGIDAATSVILRKDVSGLLEGHANSHDLQRKDGVLIMGDANEMTMHGQDLAFDVDGDDELTYRLNPEHLDLTSPGANIAATISEVDMLKLVACVEGSMDYQRFYQEARAYFTRSSLDFRAAFGASTKWQIPQPRQLANVFFRQLRDVKRRAETSLGKRVEISAISLPDYWWDEIIDALLQATTQLNMNVGNVTTLSHEETARLAYNLGDKKNNGTWFLVLVEYNTDNLYLTFTEINDEDDPKDHPQYPVDGQYLLDHLGEASPARAPSNFDHYENISKALELFLLNHVAKDPENIPESRDQSLAEFPYSDIKAVILTGDASDYGMYHMDRVLHSVFADLPQRPSGNIFSYLKPSHVGALGVARAVRAKAASGDVIMDIYDPCDLED